jgi:hypothetical protein
MQPNPQRDVLESIVKSLDTGTLVNMLAQQGIHLGQPADGGESPLYSSEKETNSQAWNNIKIDLKDGGPKQPIHSPEAYLKPRTEERDVEPEYLAAENPPSLEPWHHQGMAR